MNPCPNTQRAAVRLGRDEEREYWERWLAGDTAALVELTGLMYRVLYSYVTSTKWRDRGQPVEDVVQEVIKDFLRVPRYDPDRARLSTYICSMARKKMLAAIPLARVRKRHHQQVGSHNSRIQRIVAVRQLLNNPAVVAKLQRCLDSLSRTKRVAFLQNLGIGEGPLGFAHTTFLGREKIAREFGISEGRVQTVVKEAEDDLRTCLADLLDASEWDALEVSLEGESAFEVPS